MNDTSKDEKQTIAELVRPSTEGLPIKYELACREADVGMSWAKILGYAVYLDGGIFSVLAGYNYIMNGIDEWHWSGQDSKLYIWLAIACLIYAVISFWASYAILQRKKYASKTVMLAHIILVVFLLVGFFTEDGKGLAIVGIPVLIFLFLINKEYFDQRKNIFILD